MLATSPAPAEHLTIRPSILYFGTPVVLITTMSADGSANVSPMSSAWALGDRVVLGISSAAQGAENLRRTGECVLNFPSPELWQKVESIARLTGRDPVPEQKAKLGFEYENDKFLRGGFTPLASEIVTPPRIADCPLQCEAKLMALHDSAQAEVPAGPVPYLIAETRVVRVHAHHGIVVPGTSHIDTERWSPLLYVFRHYFGTGPDLGRNFRAEA